MRRKLTCLFVLAMTAFTLHAQETVYDSNGRQDPSDIWVNKVDDGKEWRDENRWHDPFDIYAGPVVGMVASNLTQYDGKFLFWPYIGGIIQAYFNNHFGMSLEFGYNRQGVRDAWQSFDSEHSAGPYEYRLDYISTIYKLRYYPIRHFNVNAGLMFGVHINAKSQLDGKDTDIKDHLRKRAAHIIAGAGYEFDNLYFEGFYGFPLSRLAKTELGRRALQNAKEHVFLLTVGYKFKIY